MSNEDKEAANHEYYSPHEKIVMVPLKVSYHYATGVIYAYDKPSLDDVEKAMKLQEKTHILRSMERAANGGLGIQCLKTLLSFLADGRVDEAKGIYHSEMDKLRQYPTIVHQLGYMFGCHLHFNQNCKLFPCERDG